MHAIDGMSRVSTTCSPLCSRVSTTCSALALAELLAHDLGELILAKSSILVARRLLLINRAVRSDVLRHVFRIVISKGGTQSLRVWLLSESLDNWQYWKDAGLPPWSSLERSSTKQYSVFEWSCQKAQCMRALQTAVRLPYLLCAPVLAAGCATAIEVVQFAASLRRSIGSIGEILAQRVALMQDVHPAPDLFVQDRRELPDAIRGWALDRVARFERAHEPRAQVAGGSEPSLEQWLKTSLGTAHRPPTHLVEWASSFIVHHHHHHHPPIRLVEWASTLLDSVSSTLRHRAVHVLKSDEGGGGSEKGDAGAVLNEDRAARLEREAAVRCRQAVLRAALALVRDQVAPKWHAHLGAENAPAAERDAEEAAADSGCVELVEEQPLVEMLQIEPGEMQHPPGEMLHTEPEKEEEERRLLRERRLRVARGFLRGPNGSRAHASAFELYVALRRKLLEEETSDGRTGGGSSLTSMLSVAGREILSRDMRPIRRVLQAQQHATTAAATRRPSRGHVCGASCVTPGLASALSRELTHLLKHCAGSGVSAFPEDEACLTTWLASVDGPDETPWQGRRVQCRLCFCPRLCGGAWPHHPPKLSVCPARLNGALPHHPNVDAKSGAVCMDLLQQQWSCAGGVLATLLSFRSLLASPNTSDASSMPANLDAAGDLLTNPTAYFAKNAERANSLPRIP